MELFKSDFRICRRFLGTSFREEEETETGAPVFTSNGQELPTPKSEETFASMLRNSAFMQIGNPEGKVKLSLHSVCHIINDLSPVIFIQVCVGKIYHVVDDDLYIDFGFKFPAICQKPFRSRVNYARGDRVRVLIKKLEVQEKFLGFEKPMTLLEADCVLLGPCNYHQIKNVQ